MKRQNAIIILISSLVIAGAILGYGYLNYLSKKEALKLEQEQNNQVLIQEQATKAENERKYNECVAAAESYHEMWWNASCKNFGSSIEYEDQQVYSKSAGKVITQKVISHCSLPSYNADQINAKRDKDIENCVKLYSAR